MGTLYPTRKVYTVVKLSDLLLGLDMPLGLTHGVYMTQDGFTKAMAPCHSEQVVREVCAALTEREQTSRRNSQGAFSSGHAKVVTTAGH
jgi:hypothetical protein